MRRIGKLLLAIAFTLTVRVAVPPIAVACSCAMAEAPMQTAAGDPTTSVFTGIAGPSEIAGVQVKITRWFQGAAPPTGIAVLDPAGFENVGMCGTTPPGQGTEWIFVSSRDDVGRFSVNLCTIQASLDTPEGGALLASAVQVFGDPAVPVEPPPDDVGGPSGAGSPIDAVIPILIGGLFAVGLVGALFGILGRRSRDLD